MDIHPYATTLLNPYSWLTYRKPQRMNVKDVLDAGNDILDSVTGGDHNGVQAIAATSPLDKVHALYPKASTKDALVMVLRYKYAKHIAIGCALAVTYLLATAVYNKSLLVGIISLILYVGIGVGYFFARKCDYAYSVAFIDNPYLARFAQWVNANATRREDVLWSIYALCAELAAEGYYEFHDRFDVTSDSSVPETDLVYTRAVEYLTRYAVAMHAWRMGQASVMMPEELTLEYLQDELASPIAINTASKVHSKLKYRIARFNTQF